MLPQLSRAEVKRCGLPSRSNVPRDFINKDTYHESARQRKVIKYLRESYYDCIECFIANFLAALMRK